MGWVGLGHTKWTHGQLWCEVPKCRISAGETDGNCEIRRNEMTD